MEIPTVGRVVHYVNRGGQCRPAFVTRRLVDAGGQIDLDRVDLTVFVPTVDIAEFGQAGAVPVPDVPFVGAGPAPGMLIPITPGTWHWPERGAAMKLLEGETQ